jgi:hypothetical protein
LGDRPDGAARLCVILERRSRPGDCVQPAFALAGFPRLCASSVGENLMRKGIAFVGLAVALVLFAWPPSRLVLVGWSHLTAADVVLAGGVFTVAIAVLIRD